MSRAALVVVGRDEELVGRQLGGAVEVDRRRGLVGAQRDDRLHAASSAASMTFSAPRMLVLTASKGLYSRPAPA